MHDTPHAPTLPALRAWLVERALPLWLRHGVDRAAGGFHEALAADSYACDAPFRRLRVVTRQIVVFSQAHRLGLAGADEAVAIGVEFLARQAALPEGGYAWRFDLANRPTDTMRDLYDHAFVLLALAAAGAVLPVEGLRLRALGLLAFLDREMAHPAGGYVESLPPRLPRRQNPHMHLLEALLAAHAAFGDGAFLERARALVDLFMDRLVERETGALPEYFGDTWRPEVVDGVFLTEPGHHCEWAWLLHVYGRYAGVSGAVERAAGRLLAFADAHGVHAGTWDLIDSVASDGAAVARSARLWPQTERLKSAFLRADGTAAGQAQAVASVARYLRPDGLWHERRGEDGAFIAGPSPASTLYHLATGILVADGALREGH